MSEREARALFDELAARTDIAWNYAPDGCSARAHLMVEAMLKKGVTPGKAWTFRGEGLEFLWVETPEEPVWWFYHVAPTVPVQTANGVVDLVFDPSIFDRPVTVEEWAHTQHSTTEVVKTRLGEKPRPTWPNDYGSEPLVKQNATDEAVWTMELFKTMEGPAPLPSARAPGVRDFFYKDAARMPKDDTAELEAALLNYLETPPTTDYARKLAKRIRAGEVDLSVGPGPSELPARERFAPMAVELVFRGEGQPESVSHTSLSLARAHAFIAKKELPGDLLSWSGAHETPFLGGLSTKPLDPRELIDHVANALHDWISGKPREHLEGRVGKILEATTTGSSDGTVRGTRSRGLSSVLELRVGEAARGAEEKVRER
jgi:hypothetical protein